MSGLRLITAIFLATSALSTFAAALVWSPQTNQVKTAHLLTNIVTEFTYTNTSLAPVTITAIDQKTRSVTLKSPNGDEDTYTVGPAVQRFNQLKVGDKINATYQESLVFEVRKPGATGTAGGTTAATSTPRSDYVLSGSVEYAGDAANAWFTLASVAEGKVVWSRTFEQIHAPGGPGLTEDSVVITLTNSLL